MDTAALFTRFQEFLRRRAFRFFAAVGAVLLALGLVLAAVYLSFQDIALRSLSLRDSEFSAQTDALSNLMEDMIRNYGMQAFYAPEVVQLREDDAISDLQRVKNLRELGTYVSSSDFVDSIMVYNRAKETIYSTDSAMLSAPADSFADQSASEMFRHLSADMRMTPLRRTAFIGQPEREQDYFSFLFFETTPEDEPTGGAVMLNVTSRWYVNKLLSFDNRESCVLLDKQGRLIASPTATRTRQARFFQKEALERADASYLLRKFDGQQLVCHFCRIESTGWYCLRILSLEQCLPGLLRLRNAFAAWLTLGVAVLAAAGAATLFFLYFPFRRIRLALGHMGAGQAEEQITELVQDSRQVQQQHLLMDLLEGHPAPSERMPPPPLTLLLIACPDSALARRILLRECPDAWADHQNGCEIALLPQLAELDALALCGQLTAHGGARCYLGAPRSDAAALPACYAALQELQRLRFWYPGQQILSEKCLEPRKAHSSLSEKQLAELLSALRGGELAAGRALWKEILESLRGDSYRDQLFAFHRVAQLLQETLSEQSQPMERLLTSDFLAGLEDIAALTERLDVPFCRISAYSVDHRRRRLSDLAAQVAHRIDVGYRDSELSPSRIADEMGMSSAYLGRLVRESLGQSIGEYMNQVRVENAGRLLRTTDLTAEAIASAVGFGNAKYFFVVFKNVTGQTPLQYRKQQQPENPAEISAQNPAR